MIRYCALSSCFDLLRSGDTWGGIDWITASEGVQTALCSDRLPAPNRRFGHGELLVSTQEPEPGDEVVLRTGGPVMTVLGPDDDRPQELFCVWFDEQRRRCQGTFHSALLKIVEPVG